MQQRVAATRPSQPPRTVHRTRQRRSHAVVSAASTDGQAARPSGPRICVLGGGFGGLYAALRLESLPWPQGGTPEVTLVDRSPRFTFKPLLYELLTGQLEEEQVAPQFQDLLASTRVRFEQGRVDSVTPDCPLQAAGALGGLAGSLGGGSVRLADGRDLPYDWLVLALGAEQALDLVPGAQQHALPFSSLEDAQRLARAVEEAVAARKGAPVRCVVVGGALAGVELAAAMCSRLAPAAAHLSLVVSGATILQDAPEGQRASATAALATAGVRVLSLRRVTRITCAADDETQDVVADAPFAVYTQCSGVADGDVADAGPLPADLVLWTAGQRPSGAAPLGPSWAADALGHVRTDSTLRVRGHERVFALGDASSSSQATGGGGGGAQAAPALPATAQVAFQQADYAAWNLWALTQGRPLLPFRYQHLGEMMSLGSAAAAVQLPLGAQGVSVDGPLAALLRRAAYVYRQPTQESRIKVGMALLQTTLTELSAAMSRSSAP